MILAPASILSFGLEIISSWRSSATLLCDNIGDPKPNVMWFYEKKMLNMDESVEILSNGTLILHKLQRKHSGRYSCIAKNIHGKDAIDYHLLVQGEN